MYDSELFTSCCKVGLFASGLFLCSVKFYRVVCEWPKNLEGLLVGGCELYLAFYGKQTLEGCLVICR